MLLSHYITKAIRKLICAPIEVFEHVKCIRSNFCITFCYSKALPYVLQDLEADLHIVVNDSLSAICSFQAIPEATITWLGPSDGRHDDMVLNITNVTDSTGPYDVTTSTMSWLDVNLENRTTVSGNYTCRANNIHGDVTSKTMDLDVLCECVELSTIYMETKNVQRHCI